MSRRYVAELPVNATSNSSTALSPSTRTVTMLLSPVALTRMPLTVAHLICGPPAGMDCTTGATDRRECPGASARFGATGGESLHVAAARNAATTDAARHQRRALQVRS